MKHGILLFNLGGPWTLKDVKPFLYKLFSDPAVLVGIPAPIRQLIALTISQVKGRESVEIYRKIGGGSPQLKWTNQQAELLKQTIAGAGKDVRVEIGMLASEPSILNGLKALKEWGATRVTFLPLFPQYSTTTTGACYREAEKALKHLKWNVYCQKVLNWPDQPEYISLLRQTIDEQLSESTSKPHILFSAHSLPMKIVERGDSYPEDVQRTIQAITKGLDCPWSLAFQSRNGKMPWLQPYTEDEIQRLGQNGVKDLLVVPISFVSDHIETLYELDILYADQAKNAGIKNYRRTRSFNDDPRFAQVLASTVN